ncbi:MAG: hypothetical protein ABFE16_16200 [Armatimonadia bacterium]
MTESVRSVWRVALVFWLALGLRAQLLVLLPERVTQWMVPMESNWDEPAPPARYAVLAAYLGIAMFATWLASRRLSRWWRSPRALRQKSWAAAAFPTAYRTLASVAETPCGHQLGIVVPVVVGWTAAVAIAASQSWLGPPPALDDAIAALLLWVVSTALFIDAVRRGGPRWTFVALACCCLGGCLALASWLLWAPWWNLVAH